MSPDGTRIIMKAPAADVKDTYNLEVVDTALRRAIASIQVAGQFHYSIFSPDGSRAVAVNRDGAMTIWDTNTGRILRAIAAPPPGPLSDQQKEDISPDGKRIAAGGTEETGQVQVWDIPTGTVIATLPGQGDRVMSVKFSPNGLQIAVGYHDGRIGIWDVATGHVIHSVAEKHGDIGRLAYSPDGSRIAAVTGDTVIRIWHAVSGTQVAAPGTEYSAMRLAFTPDGTRLVSGKEFGPLHVWGASDEPATKTLTSDEHRRGIATLCFSADDKILAAGSTDGSIGLWKTESGKLSHVLSGFPAGTFGKSVACSPGGPYLAASSSEPNERTIRVWDINSGEVIRTFDSPIGGIRALAFSRDGSRMASGSTDKTANIWDVSTGRIVRTIKLAGGAVGLDFSPDGRRLVFASGQDDEAIFQVWDTVSGKPGFEMTLKPAQARLKGPLLFASVAYSLDGRFIACGYSSHPVSILDSTTGRPVASLAGSVSLIALSWHPDGTRLAISWSTKPPQIWGGTSGELLLGLEAPYELTWDSLAFSHNGAWFAAGAGDGTVKLWNSALPSSVKQLK